MPTDDPLAPLTLVVGDEELLVSRAVSAVVRAARAADPDAEVHDVLAGELERGDLGARLSPSLFGERRVLVLRQAQELAPELAVELGAALDEALEAVSVVVVHAGGAKGKAVLTGLLARRPRRVEAAKVTKFADRREFLRRELRAGKRVADEEAVAALLESVGTDLRELAGAADQLRADTEGPITLEAVQRFHRGRAESSGFTVAERAVEGDLGGALELARWGRSTGLAPVLVTSALASTLRSMAQVASAGRGPARQLADQLGMPSWKVDKSQRQVRGWRPEGLSQALAAVARADADVKGGAVDQGYAVERMLISVCRARREGQ